MSLLSKRIKELRKSKKLTQKQLGDLVDVTKVSICGFEKGNRTPSLDTLKKLSEVFEVKVDYLIGNDTYMVAEKDDDYGINISKEEIIILKELRKYPDLFDKLIDDPKRVFELINKKLK